MRIAGKDPQGNAKGFNTDADGNIVVVREGSSVEVLGSNSLAPDEEVVSDVFQIESESATFSMMAIGGSLSDFLITVEYVNPDGTVIFAKDKSVRDNQTRYNLAVNNYPNAGADSSLRIFGIFQMPTKHIRIRVKNIHSSGRSFQSAVVTATKESYNKQHQIWEKTAIVDGESSINRNDIFSELDKSRLPIQGLAFFYIVVTTSSVHNFTLRYRLSVDSSGNHPVENNITEFPSTVRRINTGWQDVLGSFLGDIFIDNNDTDPHEYDIFIYGVR